MGEAKNTILIVDDQTVNRKVLGKQLGGQYALLEAANGREALELIEQNKTIGVVLLDLVMPVMDGFAFLAELKARGRSAIPVIVMTASDDEATEEQALEAGALDFVKKPANTKILRSRIENAMMRNHIVLLQRMEFIATHDNLTKLYNRSMMFAETRRMLDKYPELCFAFVRFDIDKFRMYNSAMGEAEGNRLLCCIADAVRRMAGEYPVCTYGRIDADVFCICLPYDADHLHRNVRAAQAELSRYRPDYSLDTSFGICIVKDASLSVETIFTHASLAADKCKNLYDVHYAYYDAGMSEQIAEEQEITNEMRAALEQEQFKVYLQPKYDLKTDLPCGAEALVRWQHPQKGLIPPGKFVPVFERNGFVATLDYYMWEHVCRLIQTWLARGQNVAPISVNMSRVSLFNRRVDELIIGLVKKYQVPPRLLNLEITESAYMANPEMMEDTIQRLRRAGFLILMDDFGSGYSSLNTLKQIDIDILKLDMKFMPNGSDKGRSERILSSIVRMAGWLGMDVVAEGVETLKQKEFLESIGCGYVQGYYYARPMPVEEYETLMRENEPLLEMTRRSAPPAELSEAVWSANPHIGELLSSIDAPVVILEYSSVNTEVIRANQAYLDTYGPETHKTLRGSLSPEEDERVRCAFDEAVLTGSPAVCEFRHISGDGCCRWLRLKARKVAVIPKSAILCCLIEEITREKLYENKLMQLAQVFEEISQKKKLLVIDDVAVGRAILRSMFEGRYEILEAQDGEEGLALLKEYGGDIAAILLDMIMPRMGGEAFLREKNRVPGMADIPVVVISAESDAAVQLGMLKNGVSDYIIKPFDLAITQQRVENAMAYQSRFKQLVEEYRAAIEGGR